MDDTHPSYEPELTSPYGCSSPYTKLVTVLAAGTATLNFLFPFGVASFPCAASIFMTGCISPPSPALKSQTQMPPSLPPVLSKASFVGSQVTHFTVLAWPRRVWSGLLVGCEGSKMTVVWSPEAVAMWVSRGDHWTSKMPLAWRGRIVRWGSVDVPRRSGGYRS